MGGCRSWGGRGAAAAQAHSPRAPVLHFEPPSHRRPSPRAVFGAVWLHPLVRSLLTEYNTPYCHCQTRVASPPFVFLSLFFGRSSDRWFDTAIFYLHRGFFAKAVEDHPDDPLGSKYAPSFLAAYNSACSFVGLVKSLYSQHPRLTERMWFLFTHVFSCSVRCLEIVSATIADMSVDRIGFYRNEMPQYGPCALCTLQPRVGVESLRPGVAQRTGG